MKKRMNIGNSLLLLLVMITMTAYSVKGQAERKLIREGNKLYKEKKFTDAEVDYKKSLHINRESAYGQFNLGDAYYKQGRYEEAVKQFTPLASDKRLGKDEQAMACHNLGNAYLQSKKYEESIQAYKNSLKLNPKDQDTRYNLAYAQAMLQKQQQNKGKKENKDSKGNKDQQNQGQDKDKKQDQKQEEQKQNSGDKKKEEKQAQKQPQKISKEDAEKILQALNNDEKNTQKKMQKREAKKMNIEKNW